MAGAAPGGWQAALQDSWARPRPDALAVALTPFAWLYAALAAGHRDLYRLGWRSVERAPVPVVVVGNLVAGGAGKTPTVLAVVQTLRARGWQPGVISRGYGASAETPRLVTPESDPADVGDEPLLLRRRAGVPVAVARQRIAAARALCAAHPEVDVLIADDGLQHHALARDAQVIVFDERGAGNGLLLPAGPLREPLARTVPPRSLVLYNAELPTTPWPGFIGRRVLSGVRPLADWWRGSGEALPLATLAGRPLLAAAGLARPGRFFSMLREASLTITELPLPDHHDFATLPWPADTADVIVTEKDAVKLDPGRTDAASGPRIWVAQLDFHPEPGFGDALAALLPPRPAPATPA